MFCPPRRTKKKVSANELIPVCSGVYIHFISISPLSAVLSFLKIFSTHSSGSTKLLLITNYHISIFPWTPKGFIFPESFLNFLLNLYIPPWLRKSFKQNLKLIVLNYRKYMCGGCLCEDSKTIFLPRQIFDW